ncbi:hypothetical protein SAZ11_22970 [Streptomyces sp. FXJ1.4098]|uniref:hypothetical protein n=1 Tax=Streptomyces sp. NPDC020845 TaxID=3365096 RepID=UPI002993DE3C|nr:hypothetical protein [Streptomyces sp. FXJ1.4098]
MSAGRGDRAAPPAPEGHWEVRFADAASAKGWESLAQRASPLAQPSGSTSVA